MNTFTKKEKLDFVLEKVQELGLTAYEIGKKTELSISGVEKILNKTSKKPQEETLNRIILFLESLESKNYKEPIEENKKINEEKNGFSKEDLEQNPLVKCLNEKNQLFVEVIKLQNILRNNNIDFKNIFEDLDR
jgi:transcriptional regulator with XRE-family HTH domain